MDYRPDIDGLRTIAVLPVVFFHFGFSLVSGGFVGVDIFFVISGYLITGIIAAELSSGSFTILGFYERRVKRIMPALTLMVVVTAIVAAMILTPRDLGRFASEVWWSSFFSSNILFFRKDGYFDGASAMRLLLHTWSLSVEEQYYIVIPLFLLAGWRYFKRRLVTVLLFAAVTSLALSAYSVAHHPSAAFYLLPARAWELLCGSLLALASPRGNAPGWARDSIACAGAIAIVAAIIGYDASTAFPGLAALLPCLGATALLWAGERNHSTIVGRFLCLPPMVAIGRISYSLYLWHWPILVLAKYYLLREPDTAESIGLIALSLAASVISFVFVEQPFRKKAVLRNRLALFAAAIGVLVAMNLFGSVGKTGFPGRLDAEAKRLAAYGNNRDPDHDRCMDLSSERIRRQEVCDYGQPRAGRPDFAVWGDSHSGALMPAFRAMAVERGWWGVQLGFPGCPPLVGVSVVRSDSRETLQCPDINEAALELIAARGIHTVVLVARWPIYSEPWPRIGADARNKPIFMTDSGSPLPDAAGRHDVFERGLGRTVSRLREMGVRILVVEPLPEPLVDVPSALAISRVLHRDSSHLGPDLEQVAVRVNWVRKRLADAQQAGHLSVVPVQDLFCDQTRCAVEKDGVPLYRDVDHLSIAGAMLLRPRLETALSAR